MGNVIIKQYLHRPNATELGLGNTHETYLHISTKIDLTDIFPLSKPIEIEDINSSKKYVLKSSVNGSEFRVNQMADIYRDYNVIPGDEIIITEIINDGFKKLLIEVKKINRIIFFVEKSQRTEILNINKLQQFKIGTNQYEINLREGRKINVSFLKKEKKRKDSPEEIDYYLVKLDDVALDKGDYYLDLDTNVFVKLEKSEYNLISLERSLLTANGGKKKLFKSLSPIILYGPPGTGKTYKMQNDYISKFEDNNKWITTFHQSFSYEEFVEGIKPVMNSDDESGDIKYKIENGIFKEACERAAKLAGFANLQECINASFEERNQAIYNAINDGRNVLLCIDEINRGNVAAIFGDLISLIETNKRLGVNPETEMKVKLPYSKEYFGVPANLLIVGTMNTADRSIQLLDTALRRRFKFKELLPEYALIKNEYAKTILKNINARIRCLLNKDNQIGHAYFIHANSMNEILSAMVNKVIPLLEEYFYNDTEKIRFVLNEDGKTDYTFYVMDEDAKKVYDLYNKEGIDDDKNFYRLNEKLNEDLNEEECTKFLNNLLTK